MVRQYFDEKTGTTAAPNTRLEFATSWRGTANSRLRREFGHNSCELNEEKNEERRGVVNCCEDELIVDAHATPLFTLKSSGLTVVSSSLLCNSSHERHP